MYTAAQCSGRIADLSLSGCLNVPERNFLFCEQQRVEITFCVNRLFFRVQGYIRNARPDGSIGIEFAAMSERTKHQLTELIEEFKVRALRRSAPPQLNCAM